MCDLHSAIARAYSGGAHSLGTGNHKDFAPHVVPHACTLLHGCCTGCHVAGDSRILGGRLLQLVDTVGGICGAWSDDFGALEVLLDQCKESSCACRSG